MGGKSLAPPSKRASSDSTHLLSLALQPPLPMSLRLTLAQPLGVLLLLLLLVPPGQLLHLQRDSPGPSQSQSKHKALPPHPIWTLPSLFPIPISQVCPGALD